MKRLLISLSAAFTTAGTLALPQVGYYKARYSADKNYTCMQVTSNTKQVVVEGAKLTYFEIVSFQNGVVAACIPQLFLDTDDTPSDGDPAHPLFTSSGFAHCSFADGSGSLDLAFSSKRFFWTGDSFGRVSLPGFSAPAVVRLRERQTLSAEFYSAENCPP